VRLDHRRLGLIIGDETVSFDLLIKGALVFTSDGPDSLLFEVDEDDEQVRVRVERKSVSFADYEGAWREGKGISLAEVDE
jgi:hypothetical protein